MSTNDATPSPPLDHSDPTPPARILPKPEDSLISIVESAGSTMIVMPIDGFTGIPFAYAFIGSLLLLFFGGIFAFFVLMLVRIEQYFRVFATLGGVPMMIICGLLTLAGGWTLVWSHHLAKRKTVLTITDADLILTRASFLKNEESSMPIANITRIRCVISPDGFEANRDMVLQILIHDENAVELFPGRDKAELLWLAQELRRAVSH